MTTRNHTIEEIKKDSIASPLPLPPKGAPATLQRRRQKGIEMIEKFKARFGRADASAPFSQEQWEKRRAEMLAALRAPMNQE